MLGGSPTHPTFFGIADAEDIVIKASGEMRVSGAGVELRIVRSSDGVAVTSALTPGDTSGAWDPFSLTTDVALALTPETYILEGRLNGAAPASVRFTVLQLRGAK